MLFHLLPSNSLIRIDSLMFSKNNTVRCSFHFGTFAGVLVSRGLNQNPVDTGTLRIVK